MAAITIYHNGQCSKSRGALELLQESGIEFDVRWYMTDPLSTKELTALLKKLSMQPSELVRRSQPLFKENYADKIYTEEEWLAILIANPALIERPIVQKGRKAIVARPPELALTFIK